MPFYAKAYIEAMAEGLKRPLKKRRTNILLNQTGVTLRSTPAGEKGGELLI